MKEKLWQFITGFLFVFVVYIIFLSILEFLSFILTMGESSIIERYGLYKLAIVFIFLGIIGGIINMSSPSANKKSEDK